MEHKPLAIRVAVVGGGPAGSSAAEVLVIAGIDTYLFERKLDNAKPCGGAIPLCMVDEFDLPPEIIDRRVRKMKMISPSNIEVNIGSTLKDGEYIGMCRREVLDGILRDRAEKLGTKVINGTVHKLQLPDNDKDPYILHYADHSKEGLQGEAKTLKVDMVIGADGLFTVHTHEAGYGLVGSAKQGERRIIFVITGLDTAAERAQESQAIINWAFRQFSMRKVANEGQKFTDAPVWMGNAGRVGLVAGSR